MNILGRWNGLGLAMIFAAFGVVGCNETLTTSAASAGSAATTTRVAYITDPSLNNMNAVAVTIPSRWQFHGTLFQGDSCETVPVPIYKSISPDGVTTVEREPGMAWKWGSGPAFARIAKGDCLPLSGPMSANDFLKYFAGSMHLNYLGPDQVPAAVQAKAQKKQDENAAEMAPRWASLHATPPRATFELGRALVSSQKGNMKMKGRLDVRLDCLESISAGQPELVGRPARMTTGPSSTVNTCWANVTYLNVPEAKFADVARAFDAAQMGGAEQEDAWKQAWMQRLSDQTREKMRQFGEIARHDMWEHQQDFEHDQRVRQDMHNEFMNSFQQNFAEHQTQVNANMDARMAAASDWTDYAGDRQTVRDKTTGLIYKESNQLPVGDYEVKVHGDGTTW